MKIRSHLLIFILGAVLPILAFSAVMTTVFWREQRQALEQRFLDRVRGMTIALDREIDGNIRSLQMLAESPHLQSDDLRSFHEQIMRARSTQSTWANIILNDPASGRQVINLRFPFGVRLPETTLDKSTLLTVTKSGRPFVPPILKGRVSGSYTTTIVVPVKTGSGRQYTLVAVIDPSSWLRFLSSYPVATDATLTLLDQNGIIIARTLNSERWVGQRPSPGLTAEARRTPEGTSINQGLEGQWFYTAHSRSKLAGWTLASGVPKEGVEAALRQLTIQIASVAAASAILAILLALLFGRRIARPVSDLARSAQGLATGERIQTNASTSIAEIDDLREAFYHAAERLRAKDSALRDSEERFRSMADTAPVLLWLSGVEKQCTYFNKPWLDFTGRTLERELGDGWAEGVHPEDRARCLETYHKGFDSRDRFEMEYRLRRGDGEYRWVLDRGAPRLTDNGEFIGYVGSCVDITERKQVEESLRESEARLRLAMQTGKVGVWDWDIGANRVMWTESLYAIHGVTPNEFITTIEGFATLIHSEDRDFVLQTLQRTLEDDAPYELEFRAIRPNGEVIWLFTNAIVLRNDGRPARMLGATMDITQRKLAEETVRMLLRISERLNSTLEVDTLLDVLVGEAIQIVDAESGVSGLYTPQGMVCHKYLHKGEFVSLENCWRPMQGLPGYLIADKAPYLTNEADADPRIAHEFYARFGVRTALSMPILNFQRELIGFFEIHNKKSAGGFTDLDKRTLIAISEAAATAIQNGLAYRRVQEAEESLREVDRRKDEYLAMLGHELRNPLGVISISAQLLRMQGPPSPEAAELRDIIDRQVEHMTRLLDDLLDVSRISRGQMKLNKTVCDLSSTVRQTVEDYRSNLETNSLHLKVHIPDRPLWVMGDRTRLAQTIGNLLHNADKFTGAGGTITVRLREEPGTRDVILTVHDTGIGMEPKLLARVFEPFIQGDHGIDRSPGGLGLGLPLVKGLIELHGGQVLASSDGAGRGFQVTIRLPLRDQPVPTTRHVNSSAVNSGACRILVIEDNRSAARTLNLFLTREGHAVEVAHTGGAGVEAARRFQPDIILCDIGLPVFDGYKVAQQLRQEPELEQVYLIGISGYGQEQDKERAWRAGFDAYLVKPINLSELERLLAKFRQENRGDIRITM
jgi:PAS domain S-box-containing protein